MIHETAIVDASAEIADDVTIGPWARIGAEVTIGTGTVIESHVVIDGPTTIGSDNHIYSFNAIGGDAQDKKFKGERATLEIGDGNVIREYCTINRGTADGGGVTRLGCRNWIMAYVHIAHDCHLGDDNVMANGASLAGHVEVGNHVTFGGFSLVHQFCTIGDYCFTALGSGITKDIPTYVRVSGLPAKPHGLNTEGLRRKGFDADAILWLKRAYKVIYKQGLGVQEAIAALEGMQKECELIKPMVEIITSTKRGIIR